MRQDFEQTDEAARETEESKYLLFRLDGDLYGTPLLGVREVIEPQPVKHIPNTVSYFNGLINIRGQVVGALDLRLRLNYPTADGRKRALLVFETETGTVAALVDLVEAVIEVEEKDLHKKPNVRSHVPLEYLIGVTTYQGQLVTLIDLNRTFSQEDLVEVRRGKLA